MTSLSADIAAFVESGVIPLDDVHGNGQRSAHALSLDLGELIEMVMDAIEETASVVQLTRCRSRIGRLIEQVEEIEESPDRSRVLRELNRADSFLDRRRTKELGNRAQQHRKHQAQTVRAQVLAMILKRPRRPRDLARELDIDPSQVSRALRELRQEGRIERGTTATEDRRAHIYAPRRAARQTAGVS